MKTANRPSVQAVVGPWLWGVRQITGRPMYFYGHVARSDGRGHELPRTARPCCTRPDGHSRQHRGITAAARCAVRLCDKLNRANARFDRQEEAR